MPKRKKPTTRARKPARDVTAYAHRLTDEEITRLYRKHIAKCVPGYQPDPNVWDKAMTRMMQEMVAYMLGITLVGGEHTPPPKPVEPKPTSVEVTDDIGSNFLVRRNRHTWVAQNHSGTVGAPHARLTSLIRAYSIDVDDATLTRILNLSPKED